MAKKPINIEYHFLVRVINNEITPKEKKIFEEWMARSEKNRKQFRSVKVLWEQCGPSRTMMPPDPLRQWEVITSRLPDDHLKNSASVKRTVHLQHLNGPEKNIFAGFSWPNYGKYLSAAAIILVMFTIGFVVNKYHGRVKINDPAQQITSPNDWTIITTQKGEKKSLMLRDGSRIHLNSSSTLKISNDFNATERKVELEGEAYLSVTHDITRPFQVKCAKTMTVVRGTEFNIKNRGTSVSVVVVKGIVETYALASQKKYKLKTGEIVSYDEVTGLSQPKKVQLRHALAWRDDKLSFSHSSLKDVMDEIERYYNVKVFFVEESLKTKTITGYFNTDSMNNILTVISITLDISVSHNNGVITVDSHSKKKNTIKG